MQACGKQASRCACVRCAARPADATVQWLWHCFIAALGMTGAAANIMSHLLITHGRLFYTRACVCVQLRHPVCRRAGSQNSCGHGCISCTLCHHKAQPRASSARVSHTPTGPASNTAARATLRHTPIHTHWALAAQLPDVHRSLKLGLTGVHCALRLQLQLLPPAVNQRRCRLSQHTRSSHSQHLAQLTRTATTTVAPSR
jgi:hypothetical protein